MQISARHVLKITLRFLLIGPPIGALLISLPLIFYMNERILFFLLMAIPGSYIFGSLPAIFSGVSFGLASQINQPRSTILISVFFGTAIAAVIGHLFFQSIVLPFTFVALISSVVMAIIANVKFSKLA